MKSILGITDELYLGLSTRIASEAQGMCVTEINKLQDRLSTSFDNTTKLAVIILLKTRVNEAMEVTNIIGLMDLNQNFRTRYIQNSTSLANLKTQLASVNTGQRGSSGNSGNSGCYIATMAYGDYDHHQVIILRNFRDNVLLKSTLGRLLIFIYYKISPTLVKILAPFKFVNYLIRLIIDFIIKKFLSNGK